MYEWDLNKKKREMTINVKVKIVYIEKKTKVYNYK